MYQLLERQLEVNLLDTSMLARQATVAIVESLMAFGDCEMPSLTDEIACKR